MPWCLPPLGIRPRVRSFLRDYDVLQSLSLALIYLQVRLPQLMSKGLKMLSTQYTMDIGQNDVTAILYLPYDELLAKLPPVVAEIKKAIETLHKNGARKFWIHGTGALGCLPQKLAMHRDDDSGLDEHGCIARFNNAAKKFNALLSEALDDLRLQLTDSTIVFVDMFAIKYDLVANHTKYVFCLPDAYNVGQIGCVLIGSLGALFNGVLVINLVIGLFAVVAIESSSQRLGRTYAVLFFAIILDVSWFILFSHAIWPIFCNHCLSPD